eukprot:c29285_g7_i1 orf=209-886(+)
MDEVVERTGQIHLGESAHDAAATTARLHLAFRTLMEMFRDRGYTVADSEMGLSKEQFIEKFGNDPRRKDMGGFKKCKSSDPTDQIVVFFPEEIKQVSLNTIKYYIDIMRRDAISHAILVIRAQKLSFKAAQLVKEVSTEYRLEVFKETDLLLNITHHRLVPKHEILTPEKKLAVMQMYKAKENQLPRLSIHDPVARYYGLTLGQMVKIIRDINEKETEVTYRIVM